MSTNCRDWILANSLAGMGVELWDRMKGRLEGGLMAGGTSVGGGPYGGVERGGRSVASAIVGTWLREAVGTTMGKKDRKRRRDKLGAVELKRE